MRSVITRSITSRALRSLAGLTAAGLLLAGCGSGPSQVGAAAIVGNTRIPVTDVQNWYTAIMRKEPGLKEHLKSQGQTDELGRQLASFTVQNELTRQAAKQEQLSVDERQVDELIGRMGGPEAATHGRVYTRENLRESARTQLLTAELGKKYFHRVSVVLDFTVATSRREAENKARTMAEGPQQAAALIDADRKAGQRAMTDQPFRADENTKLATTTPVFGADPGTVLAVKPGEGSGDWLIVLVKKRDTNAPPPATPTEEAGQKTLYDAGLQMLGLTAEHLGVRLSPRYGVWDPVGLSAVPTPGETTGLRLRSHAASA